MAEQKKKKNVCEKLTNGFTQVKDDVFDKGFTLSLSDFKVLMFVCRKTRGFGKKYDRISLSQFKKETGMSINTVRKSIESLENKKIIVVGKKDQLTRTYSVNEDTSTWKISGTKCDTKENTQEKPQQTREPPKKNDFQFL